MIMYYGVLWAMRAPTPSDPVYLPPGGGVWAQYAVQDAADTPV